VQNPPEVDAKTSLHVEVAPLLDVVVVVQGPVGPVELELTLVDVPLGLDVTMVIVVVPPQTSVVVVTVVVTGAWADGTGQVLEDVLSIEQFTSEPDPDDNGRSNQDVSE